MPTAVSHVLGPNDGETVHLLALGVRFMIDGTTTNGAFSLVEHPLPRGRWVRRFTHTIARTSTRMSSRDGSGSSSATTSSWRSPASSCSSREGSRTPSGTRAMNRPGCSS